MWLYIPSTSCRSAPASAGSTWDSAPDLSTLDSLPEQWVTVSGIALQRPYSWRGWRTRPWSQHLFQTILQISARSGAALSMWLRLVSHASLGATPESKREPMMNDGCGQLSFGSSWTWNPVSSVWKTSQVSFLEADSNTSSVTLPRAGSMRSGLLCRRPPWEPAIGETECSSWPTVRANEGNAGEYQIDRDGTSIATLNGAAQNCPSPFTPNTARRGTEHPQLKAVRQAEAGGGCADLLTQAEFWQTPSAQQVTSRCQVGDDVRQPLLPLQAARWSTPAASDDKRGTSPYSEAEINRPQGKPMTLAKDVACWPTPAQTDGDKAPKKHKGGNPSLPSAASSHQVQVTIDGLNCYAKVPGLRLRLNPAFVCYLMGTPFWWTRAEPISFAAAEMVAFRSKLRWHLSNFFGD